jgi:hypothetical protein
VEILKRLLTGSALIAFALFVGFCAAWGLFRDGERRPATVPVRGR